jgi:hypothetical protein
LPCESSNGSLARDAPVDEVLAILTLDVARVGALIAVRNHLAAILVVVCVAAGAASASSSANMKYLTISASQHRERASIEAASHAVLDVLAAACIVQPAIGRTRMTVSIAIPPMVIHCLVSTNAARDEILSRMTRQVALAGLLVCIRRPIDPDSACLVRQQGRRGRSP